MQRSRGGPQLGVLEGLRRVTPMCGFRSWVRGMDTEYWWRGGQSPDHTGSPGLEGCCLVRLTPGGVSTGVSCCWNRIQGPSKFRRY